MGTLPVPDIKTDRVGVVVVSITVDKNGNVVSAGVQMKGTTIQDTRVQQADVAAAKKAKFNADAQKPVTQQGTITYTHKIK